MLAARLRKKESFNLRRIAKQRNANECQWHVMRWDHGDYV